MSWMSSLPRFSSARRAVRHLCGLLLVLLVLPSGSRASDAASPDPARAGAACGSPQQCFARMTEAQRAVARIRAHFKQTKHVAMLAEPLVSEGTFSFERPDRVRWEMVTPEALVIEISGGALRAGPPGAVADVDAGPAVGLFRDLGDLLTGARGDVDRRFALAPGPPGVAGFVLMPRDPSLARVIRSIEIVLDPASGTPRRVVIAEAAGDRTEIELSDVVVEHTNQPGSAS